MKNLYIVSLAILLQACAVGGSYKPTAPSSDVARQSCPTTEGVILDMLNVSIEQDRKTAQSIGAGVGGYIGNEATDDKDDVTQVVATLTGAMIGNVIGDAVSKSGDKVGVELIVSIHGKTQSIVQEIDSSVTFQKGDKVWIIGFLDINRYSRYNKCSNEIRVLPRS